jgi:hypothetical protein
MAMPSLFIRRTTCRPKSVRPPSRRSFNPDPSASDSLGHFSSCEHDGVRAILRTCSGRGAFLRWRAHMIKWLSQPGATTHTKSADQQGARPFSCEEALSCRPPCFYFYSNLSICLPVAHEPGLVLWKHRAGPVATLLWTRAILWGFFRSTYLQRGHSQPRRNQLLALE